MKKLAFKNPVFHKGDNVTVRFGKKWNNYRGLVELLDLEGNSFGFGEVHSTFLLNKLDDIGGQALQAEHDPSCRTRLGLAVAMGQAYENFDPEKKCTVVWFRRMNAREAVKYLVEKQNE